MSVRTSPSDAAKILHQSRPLQQGPVGTIPHLRRERPARCLAIVRESPSLAHCGLARRRGRLAILVDARRAVSVAIDPGAVCLHDAVVILSPVASPVVSVASPVASCLGPALFSWRHGVLFFQAACDCGAWIVVSRRAGLEKHRGFARAFSSRGPPWARLYNRGKKLVTRTSYVRIVLRTRVCTCMHHAFSKRPCLC